MGDIVSDPADEVECSIQKTGGCSLKTMVD